MKPPALLWRMVPWLAFVLVVLGPLFFYQTVLFLRKLDYVGALFCLLSGWFLLRAGVDLCRAVLASEVLGSQPTPTKASPTERAVDESP